MPDLERTIDIIFRGVDDTTSVTNRINRNLDQFGSQINAAAQPVAEVTEKLLALEAAALAVAFALGKTAYDASVEFESAQVDLAKVLDESDGDVNQYTDSITELALQYGRNSAALVQSAADFKQAGFSAADATTLLNDALDLAIAGNLELADSSDIVVRSLKGFNLGADEAARVVQTLEEVSNRYNATAGELGQGLAKLAPTADTLGFSLEQTAGLLVPIIERFGSGREAATALQTGLNRLIAPTKSVQDALAELGIAQRDSNNNLRGAPLILADVQRAFQGLDSTQQQFYATQLTGVEQSGRLVTVFQNLEKTAEITQVALTDTGAVSESVARQLESAAGATDRTAAAFNALLISIGTGYRDEVVGVVDAFGELFRVTEAAVREGGALDDFFAKLAPVIQRAEAGILAFAEVLPEALSTADLTPFVNALDELLDLFSSGNLTTVEGVREALEGTAETFETLTKFSVAVIEFLKGVFSALSPLVSAVNQADDGLVKFAGTVGGLALVVGPAVSIITTLSSAISGLVRFTGSLAKFGATFARFAASAAGVAGAGVAGVGELVRQLTLLTGAADTWNEILVPGEDTLGTWLYGLINGGDEAADSIEGVTTSVAKLTREVGTFSDKGAFDFGALAEDAEALDEGLGKATFSVEEYNNALAQTVPTAGELAEQQKRAADEARGWASIIENGVVVGYEQVGGAARKNLQAAVEATELTKDSTDSARKAVLDYQLELERLASEERLRTIEAKVSLDIAEVEANANILTSILDGLASTITSTGDVLGTLFGQADEFGNVPVALRDELAAEFDARQRALDLQAKLTESQIDALNARTQSLERGDALIEISGDGLEPELEAFMWAILRRIQVRANADGQEFLLGIT